MCNEPFDSEMGLFGSLLILGVPLKLGLLFKERLLRFEEGAVVTQTDEVSVSVTIRLLLLRLPPRLNRSFLLRFMIWVLIDDSCMSVMRLVDSVSFPGRLQHCFSKARNACLKLRLKMP